MNLKKYKKVSKTSFREINFKSEVTVDGDTTIGTGGVRSRECSAGVFSDADVVTLELSQEKSVQKVSQKRCLGNVFF